MDNQTGIYGKHPRVAVTKTGRVLPYHVQCAGAGQPYVIIAKFMYQGDANLYAQTVADRIKQNTDPDVYLSLL